MEITEILPLFLEPSYPIDLLKKWTFRRNIVEIIDVLKIVKANAGRFKPYGDLLIVKRVERIVICL